MTTVIHVGILFRMVKKWVSSEKWFASLHFQTYVQKTKTGLLNWLYASRQEIPIICVETLQNVIPKFSAALQKIS